MPDYIPTNAHALDFDQLKSNIQRGRVPPWKALNSKHILNFSPKIEVQDPTLFRKQLKRQEVAHLLAPTVILTILVKRYRRRHYTRTRKILFPYLKWTLILLIAILGVTEPQPISAGGTIFKPIMTEMGRQGLTLGNHMMNNVVQGMKEDPQQALNYASQWIQNIGKKLGIVWDFKSIEARTADEKYQKFRKEIYSCHPLDEEYRCISQCKIKIGKGWRECDTSKKGTLSNGGAQYCHCFLRPAILTEILDSKSRYIERTLFPPMSTTTKGLIATVTVLGLLLLSFIVHQLVQYLRNRPPRLVDPKVRMEILDLRNRPTRGTLGKSILKTLVETKDSSSRPFVDSLRRSNKTYDDASQYEDELEEPRGPSH